LDRSRKIAELLIKRLSPTDYEYLMDGINWGIWNRVLIWLRATRKAMPEFEQLPNAATSPAAPAA
jgi:hypothetical protein